MSSTQSRLKYRIKELMNQLTVEDYPRVFAAIIQELDITDVHFRRILSYTEDTPNEAKPSQLRVIARHLGVSIEALMNDFQQNT
jgi:hypothetical protein